MVACGEGATSAVRELLSHGASVSAVDDDGLTPLLHACWNVASVGSQPPHTSILPHSLHSLTRKIAIILISLSLCTFPTFRHFRARLFHL